MMHGRALGLASMGENGKSYVSNRSKPSVLTVISVELRPGDYVTISASRFPFPSVLPLEKTKDWVDSISRTLNWNSRQRQKSFKEWS
jgi:hypothetical protein